MKRIILFAAIVFASITRVFAQSVELTPLFAYTITGKVDGYFGLYDVKDDIMYGALLDVEFAGGGACSGNVHFNVPFVHWDLSAGLIIRLTK